MTLSNESHEAACTEPRPESVNCHPELVRCKRTREGPYDAMGFPRTLTGATVVHTPRNLLRASEQLQGLRKVPPLPSFGVQARDDTIRGSLYLTKTGKPKSVNCHPELVR